jgi:hypothetical protein
MQDGVRQTAFVNLVCVAFSPPNVRKTAEGSLIPMTGIWRIDGLLLCSYGSGGLVVWLGFDRRFGCTSWACIVHRWPSSAGVERTAVSTSLLWRRRKRMKLD